MTNEQKLTLAIQNEIAENNMRELALNSLRFRTWAQCVRDRLDHPLRIEERLDMEIIASIPDDAQLREIPQPMQPLPVDFTNPPL